LSQATIELTVSMNGQWLKKQAPVLPDSLVDLRFVSLQRLTIT